MKLSLSLIGNYMCKNPPVIVLDVTSASSDLEVHKKYLFNTPADIQRNFQSQFVRIYGNETIMFTKYSHDVLTGFVTLALSASSSVSVSQKRQKLVNLKIYGTEKHYNYFQMAKFHLGQKGLGLSYAQFIKPRFRFGIKCYEIYKQILNSDKFSYFIWKINWRLEKQPKDKINNCKENLKQNQTYYEDEYMIIKPFFQRNPSIQKSDYLNSVTHFLCIFKNQAKIKQNQQNENTDSKNTKKATLIITYQSLQQVNKILQRKDAVEGVNSGIGLLQFIEKNINHQQNPNTSLSTILHIIQNSQLLLCPQFYQLYQTLDSLCKKSVSSNSSQSFTPYHLFYGYGIKSSSTDLHHLMNTYYKGIRFYSLCSRLLRFFPNINLNHYSYWSKIFERDFVDIERKITEMNLQRKSLIGVYKPIHRLLISSSQSSNPEAHLASRPYEISAELLSMLQYPLFNTSTSQRPNSEFMQAFNRKAQFLGYYGPKARPKKSIGVIPEPKKLKQFDPKVIFLGTNSKTPQELRNVSGILLEINTINEERLILMDCGAGTYEQFMYHYTPEELPKKLLNLKVIFMTHLHADHTLGILDIIHQRNQIMKTQFPDRDDKVFLVLPFNMFNWVYYYSKTVQPILEGSCQVIFTQTLTGQKIDIRDEFFSSKICQINLERNKLSPGKMFIKNKSNEYGMIYEDSQHFNKYVRKDGSFEDFVKTLKDHEMSALRRLIEIHSFQQPYLKESFDAFMAKMKIKKFKPTKVFHCPFSYGIVIEHNNGLKISYSGDCRPTEEFLQQAKQSALLIHEATFSSNMQQKAIKKLHSTFQQALQAGLRSKSAYTCTTHFTPGPFDRDAAQNRTQNPFKPEVLYYYQKKAIIACDHIEFRLSDLQEVSKVSKIISHLGSNKIVEKNFNPFSLKSQIRMGKLRQSSKQENEQNDEDNEDDFVDDDDEEVIKQSKS